MSKVPEISKEAFENALPRRQRERLMRGQFESGADIAALRRFVGLSQANFARALGISVHTLRNWEQGRRKPDGPGLALLRIAAGHVVGWWRRGVVHLAATVTPGVLLAGCTCKAIVRSGSAETSGRGRY